MMNSKSNNTLYERQQADVEAELGGRWAKPKPLIGGAAMPEQPATSPWASDPVGVEPPLGFSVDAVEPVGEVFEIERSMAIPAVQQTEQDDENENDEGPE